MTARIPLILDSDSGHQDALAIATVVGYAGLAETTRNAGRALTFVGRSDIPVAPGAVGPLLRSLHVAEVDRASELTRGRTVVDRHGLTRLSANADVILEVDREPIKVDREPFIDLILEALGRVRAAER